ncbi:DUF2207 domain-containing protein [Propionibacteriaceae bacterium G1746]|uniref:DUF2207 domain-containing protein n=1 Tax=Aestuariimicrobium sp. G57 TaxID=3418485 RepID=UPI003C181B86
MDSTDIGLLVLGALVLLVMTGVYWISRRFAHDRIFAGPTPGQLPGPGQPVEVARVKPGREYSGEVAVQFQPPKGLTPGLVGTVVDGKADMHDVTATIVDLAVRDYLKISAVDAPDGPDQLPARRGRAARQPKPKDWVITQLRPPKPRPGEKPLLPFEARLLQELFATGRTVHMSELGSRFANTMRATQAELYESVVARGWYDKHPQRGAGAGCFGALSVVAGTVFGIGFVLAGASVGGVIAGAMVFGGGILGYRALQGRVPRTAEGTAVHIQTLGFKKYLATAEADQIKFEEAADIFSRYLPYAIVFGVADHWAKVFGEVAARARLEGYDVPMVIDWFDGLYLGAVVFDLLDASDGIGLLDFVSGEGLDMLGSGVEGIASLAEGVGDFIDGIDFDFDF